MCCVDGHTSVSVRLLLARVTWGHVHQAVQVIVLTLQILTSGIMFGFLQEEASERKKECSFLVSSQVLWVK